MIRASTAVFILQGNSDYNALTVMNQELARELRAQNIEPVLLDLTQAEKSIALLTETVKNFGQPNVLAAFSFSGMGVDVPGENSADTSLWQKLKIPLIAWMLDHPAYYILRHAHPAPAVMRLYTTKDFEDFQRDYVRAPFRTGYCRFGTFNYGKEAKRREPKKGETPLIIFPKSSSNVTDLENTWKMLPTAIQKTIHHAIDHYWGMTARSGSVVPSVLAAADATHMELRNDLPLFSFFIAQVDRYFRHRKSNVLAQELLKLPVRIYGKGFEHINISGARAKILPPLDYANMMDQFHEALAVVTLNPNIDDEGHDRIFSAFGCGAMPVTDINPWWRTKFPNLLSYSYDFHNKPVTAAIEHILADPMRTAQDSWQAGERMRHEQPFSKSVAEAVELARMHRYFTFDFKTPMDVYVRHGA